MPDQDPSADIARVIQQAQEHDVRFFNLQFTDMLGIVKSVTIPFEQFADCAEHGKWFDGSSVEGFARIAESDMFLMPDLATFDVIPWERGHNTTARVICDVFEPNGEAFAGDPRHVLKRMMGEAEKLGYMYNTGPELEFFLFSPGQAVGTGLAPAPHDQGGYFDLSTDLALEVRKEMVNALHGMRIRVETSHHEVAAGQHEIDFEYGDAVATADNAVTFKYTLKAIAQNSGLYATFMPKPLFGVNGSGMHTHQSLADLRNGNNLFTDTKNEYGISELARKFIAGQLKHARGMCAILAPLVNSYKRLVPGYEAPVYVSWARTNRSALIRVPKTSKGKPQSARVELRCPDPSCNPYLAFAVMLAAGLDGVKNDLPTPDAVEENLYHLDQSGRAALDIQVLPGSLDEALHELENDEVIRAALGEHIVERFIEAKRQEWDDYRMQVTDWERQRYLELY